MAEPFAVSIDRLPTLTEVLELGRDLRGAPQATDADVAGLAHAPAVEQGAPLELLMPTAEAPAVPLDALTSPLPEGSPDAAPEFTLPVLHDLAQPVLPMPWSVTPRMAPAPSPPPIAHRAPFDEEAIVARVLEELEPRVAALLEARVSEALAPALARAADGLIRDSRKELSGALRELVEESLAQVQRERDRG